MSDKGLSRFSDRLNETSRPTEEPEEKCGAFGFLRGSRDRTLMLELRFKDNSVVAFSYALLERVSFDPSDGIRIWFPGQRVRIVGQQLNHIGTNSMRLFDALVRHRAVWIQEAGRADVLEALPGVPIVELIELE